MVARRRSRLPRRKFSANWIAAVRVKVKSRPNGKKKTIVKFFPESSRAKPLVRRSEFWFATKTRDQKTTPRSRKRFGHRTLISPTKPNTGFETGRAGDELRRGKQSAALPQARLHEKFCKPCIRRSTSWPTSWR